MHRHPLAGRAALRLVAVQQPGRRPAPHLGGELPAQVDRVLQAQVEAGAADRRVHVRGVADEQDPAGAVPLGEAGVAVGEPAQQVRSVALGRAERHVDPEHPPGALAQLRDGERGRVVHFGLRHLVGAHHVGPGGELREHEQPAVGAVVLERRDEAVAGHVQPAGRRVQQFGRDADVRGAGDHAVLGHTGKPDAGELAGGAVPAVRPDEVPGLDPVGPVRPAHLDRDRVGALAQPGQLVPAPHLDAELGGPLGEHLFDPPLRHHQQVHRVVRQHRQVQRERAEGVARRRVRRLGAAAEPFVEAAPVEHAHDLADEAVGALLGARAGEPFEDDRPDAGQGQLAGEHQAVGSGAGDEDVSGHDWVPPVRGQAGSTRRGSPGGRVGWV